MLGGNSLFWGVTVADDESVMECRKIDASSDRSRPERRGEAWHSQDGHRGGLLEACGMPPWNLIGLDTLGWIDHDNAENFGWFVVTQASTSCSTATRLRLSSGDPFGWAAPGRLPMALGHEFDLRPSAHYALRERIDLRW